jgi:hypothetical protein
MPATAPKRSCAYFLRVACSGSLDAAECSTFSWTAQGARASSLKCVCSSSCVVCGRAGQEGVGSAAASAVGGAAHRCFANSRMATAERRGGAPPGFDRGKLAHPCGLTHRPEREVERCGGEERLRVAVERALRKRELEEVASQHLRPARWVALQASDGREARQKEERARRGQVKRKGAEHAPLHG